MSSGSTTLGTCTARPRKPPAAQPRESPRLPGSSASVQVASAVAAAGPSANGCEAGGACAQAGAAASTTAVATSARKALLEGVNARIARYAHQHARAPFGALVV